MPRRSSSRETLVENRRTSRSSPPKPKMFDSKKKRDENNIKDAISRLGSGMKTLIALAEGRPRTSKELEGAIGRSEDTVRTHTKRLAAAGMIEKTPKGWVISDSKFLTSGVREGLMRANTRIKVNEALKELRKERYEKITLQDVSNKTRLPPRTIEESTYLLAPDHDLAVADESSQSPDMSLDKTSLKRPRRTPSTGDP